MTDKMTNKRTKCTGLNRFTNYEKSYKSIILESTASDVKALFDAEIIDQCEESEDSKRDTQRWVIALQSSRIKYILTLGIE